MTRRQAIIGTAGMLASGGCLSSGTDTSEPVFGRTDALWPLLGQNQQNTNSASTTIPSGALELQRIFRASPGDRFGAPIAVGDNVLLSRAGTDSHAPGAFAFRSDSGEELWHAPDVVDYTTPSIFGETAVFSGDGATAAVSIDDGTVHWRQNIGGSGKYKTHLKQDDSIIVAGGRHVVSLDAYTGEERWRSKKLGVPSGFATDGQTVFVTHGYDGESGLVALDLATGEPVWEGPVDSAAGYPVVGDGLVLVRDEGRLTALDASNGRIQWTFEIASSATAPPALSPDKTSVVYGGANEPKTHVLDLESGTQQWAVDAPSDSQPLVTKDSVFLLLFDNLLRVGRDEQEVVDSIGLPTEPTSPLTMSKRGLLFTGRTGDRTYYNYQMVTK
ncbi:PQQ-binding-like beta-propeller repeat protein [Haloarchaeobius sp. DYHT-AS-18]|uniref:outer membrane protein assembly factor BamB family protein n=1 Tax=Haloarchaeobius sp. DYHT-AS-18 TaxID=3446117 RepID=UPI003EBB5293